MRFSLQAKNTNTVCFCHANGTLVYPIKGEYVRFEAEVGIDDTSSGGSVYFQALNVVPKFVGDELIAKYPNRSVCWAL